MGGGASDPSVPLGESLRALAASPRELWIVYTMKLFESVAYFAIYSVLVLYLSDDLGYSDLEAGGLAGTWLTAVSLVVFVSGFVADSLGVRRALALAAASCVAGRGLLALGGGEGATLLGLTVMVWGVASLKPTMNAAVRAYTGPATVAFAFSLYYVLMNLGAFVQGPLISHFRATFPAGTVLWGLTFSSSELVFLVAFGASCVNLALSVFLRDPPAPATPAANPLQAAREVLSESTFWRFLGFVALLTMVRLVFQHAHLTWPKYALREFGETFPYASYWSINPAMIVLLTPFVTALTRRWPVYPTIVAGALLSALSVFSMAASTTVAASVVFIVVLSLGEAVWSPRLYEYTATIAPRGRESSYMGLSELPLFLAKPVVGFLSGWMLQTYCPADGARASSTMWLWIGLMTLAAPVAMVFLRGALDADQRSPATSRSR
jgi:dipeptide/tripeptide permease